jgi:MYXO-CTERM domain-containing protein
MARQSRTANASRIAASLAIGVAVVACGSAEGPAGAPRALDSPTTNEPTPEIGAVSLELRTTGVVQFSSVQYKITRDTFDRSGSIDVSNSTKVSAVISAIPAATGYSVALTTSAVANPLITCAGSSSFDVIAGVVSPVQVDVQCHEPSQSVSPPPVSPPPSVPIPRGTIPALALLLHLGAVAALRRRRA